MNWKIVSNKKQWLDKISLSLIFTLIFIFIFPVFGFAVTKYKGIQPGKTTKDEVSGILGEPAKEINSSSYEYPPKTSIERAIVIEYKMTEPAPIVDKMDIHFLKPVARGALAKKLNLPENPSSQGVNPDGKFQEYFGSNLALMLTYDGKAAESGVTVLSFFSRDTFESVHKEMAKKLKEPEPASSDEQPKKPTDTTASEKTEVAKLSPEAKLHMQQGMTYASLAQANPKTASENYDNALLEFTNAIKLYPNYAEAYSNRGVAYMQQKKYNKAEEDLKKAAELKPKDPIIHYNLAALYSIENKIDLALDSLDKALENGFNNYDALKPTGKQSDPDLKNLRKDAEFRKVLEKHKVFILK